MNYKEYQLKKQVAKFLHLNSVDHFIISYDQNYLTAKQKSRIKPLLGKRGFPDVFIPMPKFQYKGFFCELKATNIYKKDGTLKKNDHVLEQAKYLDWLRKQGYYACFACSLEEFEYHFNAYFYNHKTGKAK